MGISRMVAVTSSTGSFSAVETAIVKAISLTNAA